MDPASLPELLQNWGYPALLSMLCLTAFGFPIPEDLLLLSAGYLISAGVFSWPIALPVALVGVLTSDVLLYTFGRQMRVQASTSRRWRMSARRLQRFARWFDRVGAGAVFIARLVPGTRAVVFVSAGLRGVEPHVFLLYDLAGAVIWTPLLLWLGTWLGDQIGGLAELMDAAARVAFWIVAAAILLLGLWRLWRTEESKL